MLVLFIGTGVLIVRRSGCSGARSMGQECFYSIFLQILTLAAMCLIYYLAVEPILSLESGKVPCGLDKLLNLPPVVAAAWAAGAGYLHSLLSCH